MAFKSIKKKVEPSKDIEALFRDLKTNGVESLYSHQADIIRDYQENAINEKNVAIELPTGSGKTLIGLLIGEYKRQTSDFRVLYVCPTKQLVNQVSELANKKYGIKTIPFTGPKSKYKADHKTSYQNKEAIAITTYSSLFNINPFFDDADLIIIDDAHASENYIASNWSVNIKRYENHSLYLNIVNFLKENIEPSIFNRLLDDETDPIDKSTINVYPGFYLNDYRTEFFDLIDSLIQETDLKFNWALIRDHIHSCNLYYSWNEILIRPIIPPSLTNFAFKNAKQRIFMSATLGNGGDLERITGVNNIKRIAIPDGWDRQGLGRRFFQFPSLSIAENEVEEFILEAINMTPRSVFLVSSDKQVLEIEKMVLKSNNALRIFKASNIENSKDDFINSDKAVTILANRFDGIDFPGDDCRLLIIKDIPYFANVQERFLQSRVGASIIFYDRNRTRLVQAIGRCTRSPKDFAAVIVVGEKDLTEWLFFDDKHKYFHPELQAELKFGFENSRNTLKEFIENLNHFFKQDSIWESANKEIIDARNDVEVAEIEEIDKLEQSVVHELKYLYSLWDGDYEMALKECDFVLGKLSGGTHLKGYRAFWKYLKSNVSYLLFKESGEEQFQKLSSESFEEAIRLSSAFRWVKPISPNFEKIIHEYDERLERNIDRAIQVLANYNISNSAKFSKRITQIELMLSERSKIENIQVFIGELLGFNSYNSDNTAAPDPYWISNDNLIIVFEDKLYDDSSHSIPIKDIRQVSTHEKWIKQYVSNLSQGSIIYPVFLSNRKYIDEESSFACEGIYYWELEDFTLWATHFLSFIKSLQSIYVKNDQDAWREYLLKEYSSRGYTPNKILEKLLNIESIINKT